MIDKTNKTSTYLIVYILTTSFFMSRILARNLFENASKLAYFIILAITVLVLLMSRLIYKKINTQIKLKLNKLSQYLFYIHLLINSCICLIFLLSLINACWLIETRYTFILLPFLCILYYVLSHPKEVFYRLVVLCSFPILIQYLIFIFAQNKSFDFYALVPYQNTIQNPFIIILTSIQMLLTPFSILFYIQDCEHSISKKHFYVSIFIIIFTLCFDSIVVTGQFGNTLQHFPFIYYESWCLLNFGQYIGYLDILSFFYWMTSSFCYIGLNQLLIKEYYSIKLYKLSYPILFITLIFILTHASLYPLIKPILIICSSLLFIYLIKEVYFNESQ